MPSALALKLAKLTLDVLGPERHQAPARQIEAALAGLRLEADDRQLIGRRTLPGRREIRHRPLILRDIETDDGRIGHLSSSGLPPSSSGIAPAAATG